MYFLLLKLLLFNFLFLCWQEIYFFYFFKYNFILSYVAHIYCMYIYVCIYMYIRIMRIL